MVNAHTPTVYSCRFAPNKTYILVEPHQLGTWIKIDILAAAVHIARPAKHILKTTAKAAN